VTDFRGRVGFVELNTDKETVERVSCFLGEQYLVRAQGIDATLARNLAAGV
jgi:hypothetical protein